MEALAQINSCDVAAAFLLQWKKDKKTAHCSCCSQGKQDYHIVLLEIDTQIKNDTKFDGEMEAVEKNAKSLFTAHELWLFLQCGNSWTLMSKNLQPSPAGYMSLSAIVLVQRRRLNSEEHIMKVSTYQI